MGMNIQSATKTPKRRELIGARRLAAKAAKTVSRAAGSVANAAINKTTDTGFAKVVEKCLKRDDNKLVVQNWNIFQRYMGYFVSRGGKHDKLPTKDGFSTIHTASLELTNPPRWVYVEYATAD